MNIFANHILIWLKSSIFWIGWASEEYGDCWVPHRFDDLQNNIWSRTQYHSNCPTFPVMDEQWDTNPFLKGFWRGGKGHRKRLIISFWKAKKGIYMYLSWYSKSLTLISFDPFLLHCEPLWLILALVENPAWWGCCGVSLWRRTFCGNELDGPSLFDVHVTWYVNHGISTTC